VAPPTAPTTSPKAAAANWLHAVADNLDQAIEDITHDWYVDRSQRWVTRTAQPGVDPTVHALPEDPGAKRARLVAELAALHRSGPPSVTADLAAAREDLDQLRWARRDLHHGTGRWIHTPAGQAARQLAQARQECQAAEHRAQLTVGRRERHHWRRLARAAAATEARAQQDWTTHAKPMAERLDRRIASADHRVAVLESQAAFRSRWLAEHPDLARRVEHVQRELQPLDDLVSADLVDRLDAIGPGAEPAATRAMEHDDIAKVRERLDRLQRVRSMEPPGLSL
jgi:hypothetical protein